MVTEDKLIKIGFNGFTFGRKEDRDCFKRLAWCGYFFSGEPVTIRLIYITGKWEIELFKVHDDKHNEITPNIYREMTLQEIIDIVERSGTNTYLE